jgi:hypothetical protein
MVAAYGRGVLEDGTYDVVVIDAEAADGGGVSLELTVLAGTHKGELVRVTASAMTRDPLDLLAVPATLVVTDGQPRVQLEG